VAEFLEKVKGCAFMFCGWILIKKKLVKNRKTSAHKFLSFTAQVAIFRKRFLNLTSFDF